MLLSTCAADPLLKASQEMVVRELAIVQAKDDGVLFPYDNFLLWLATGELGSLDDLIWVVPLYDVSRPVPRCMRHGLPSMLS